MSTMRRRLGVWITTGAMLVSVLTIVPALVLAHQDDCPLGTFVVSECVITGANDATGTQTFGHSVRLENGATINASGGGVTLDISGDLTLETSSTIEANDDIEPANADASDITINVDGDLLMQAGTGIIAENNTAGGDGGDVTIDVGGDMTMDGAENGTGGALISTMKTAGAGDTGTAGDVVITVGDDSTASGDFLMGGGSASYGTETGARIDATGPGASGDIDITVAGNYHGEPGSVVASGGLNGTTIQRGGKIFIVVGCVLTTEGRITSKGQDPAADLVHLEGCDIVVRGLVESTGKGHTVNANPDQVNVQPANSCDGVSDASVQNEIVRAGKAAHATGCIEVWGNNIRIDSTSGWAGELNADIGNGGPDGSSWIDVFAKSSLTVTDGAGNNRTSNNLGHTYDSSYAVHANSISGSDSTVGTVTAMVNNGPLSATGKAFQAFTTGAGSDGGSIVLEASGSVDFDGAWVNATGDFNATGGVGAGGHIWVSSWDDDISWDAGDGDVRPDTGDITLNVCAPGTISTAGTDFNGEVPLTPGLCDANGPDLPGYVEFDEAQWSLCGEEETDAPSVPVVTDAPSPSFAQTQEGETDAPSVPVVTDAPSVPVVTDAPSVPVVTDAPSVPVVTDAPSPSFDQTQAGETDVATPPNTAGLSDGAAAPADSAWLLVVVLGVLLASVVVLTPARPKRR